MLNFFQISKIPYNKKLPTEGNRLVLVSLVSIIALILYIHLKDYLLLLERAYATGSQLAAN